MERLQMKEETLAQLPLYYKKRTNEAILYRFENQIIKHFYYISENKINTLYELEKREKEFEQVKELLLFQKIVVDYYTILGILMEKGYEINFQNYCKLQTTSYNDHIVVLKNIGLVLKKLSILRKQEGILTDFFIGDLHESNILVGKNHEIQICDLDSCKIGNNNPFLTKYLQFLKTYLEVTQRLQHKYPFYHYLCIPNENSDLYCYCVMIFKTLFKVDITKLSSNAFYQTLYSLKEQGLPEPLYQIFLNLYSPKENENPYLYLEDIPTNFEKKRDFVLR